jgi:DNA-binding XRE family transcriptional regulator
MKLNCYKFHITNIIINVSNIREKFLPLISLLGCFVWYLFLLLCKNIYIMSDSILKVFGFKVRSKREELKLLRDHMADSLQVHQRTHAKWENGQSDLPLGKALEIAKILKSTLSDLLGNEASATNQNYNKQEGENVYNVTFDRETMQEINARFAFLERMLEEERAEKKILLEKLLKNNII